MYKQWSKRRLNRETSTHRGPLHMLWRLIKFLLLLVILGGIALVAYAYAGPLLFPADFAAPATIISVPITLEVK